ncbi:MAG TPA: MFS transporter [Candidatus Saccharimonadales bacterium]
MTNKTAWPTSRRNAWVTIISSSLSDLAFILPVWVLFGTEQLKLSVTTTTVLFMMVWLLSGVLEIPTGALADRLGRKKMYLVGMVLFSLYPLAYVFELPVVFIALISVVAALGSALRSGTLVALTHDSYRKEGRSDKSYHAFLTNELLGSFVARAISGVAGGALYALNPRAPYIGMFLAYVGMFIVGLYAVDTTTERSTLSNRAHMAETFRQLFKKEMLLVLFGTYIAFQLVGEAIWTAYQPFFVHDGLSAQSIGMLFSVMAILSGAGAFVTKYAMRRIGVHLIEVIVAVLILITAAMLFMPSKSVHLWAIAPAAFAFGVSITPLIATAQKLIDQKFHSTVISVISVLQYVVYGIGSLYVGILIDRLGVIATKKILLIEAVAAVTAISIVYAARRKRDVVITPSE